MINLHICLILCCHVCLFVLCAFREAFVLTVGGKVKVQESIDLSANQKGTRKDKGPIYILYTSISCYSLIYEPNIIVLQ